GDTLAAASVSNLLGVTIRDIEDSPGFRGESGLARVSVSVLVDRFGHQETSWGQNPGTTDSWLNFIYI
ncbi:MAG: hypothetical protein ACLFWG_05245, partial [Longimicrobiales bacterium]